MPKYDPEYFEEKFPNLFSELQGDETKKISVDGVRTDQEEGNNAAKKEKDEGPTVIDFLRLCDTEEEALEIITHMEEEGKIGTEYGGELREQLEEEGLRSFGSKRKPGNYSYTD